MIPDIDFTDAVSVKFNGEELSQVVIDGKVLWKKAGGWDYELYDVDFNGSNIVTVPELILQASAEHIKRGFYCEFEATNFTIGSRMVVAGLPCPSWSGYGYFGGLIDNKGWIGAAIGGSGEEWGNPWSQVVKNSVVKWEFARNPSSTGVTNYVNAKSYLNGNKFLDKSSYSNTYKSDAVTIGNGKFHLNYFKFKWMD